MLLIVFLLNDFLNKCTLFVDFNLVEGVRQILFPIPLLLYDMVQNFSRLLAAPLIWLEGTLDHVECWFGVLHQERTELTVLVAL